MITASYSQLSPFESDSTNLAVTRRLLLLRLLLQMLLLLPDARHAAAAVGAIAGRM
jgi:hypothetical protein